MKNLNKILGFLILLMVFGVTQLQAQNISFNRTGAAPDPSAMLDVNDTLGGVLIPRMTMTQRNNITSPAVGLLIYQTDNTPGFYYYSGSAWTAISSTPATSNLAQVLGAGNDANNDTIYNLNVLRMGQSSAVSDEKLTIKSNNQAWGLLNTTGDVGMGFWLYDSISATDKGAGQLGTYSNHKLDFFTNNSQASMTISTDGNVGIGQATDLDNKFLVNSTTANTTGSYVGSKVKSAGTSTSGAEQIAFFSEILGGDGTNVAGYFTAENSSAGFNRGLISKGSNANENYGGEFVANSNGSNLGNAAIVATTNGQGTSYNYGIYTRASGNHSGANSGIYARADSANTNTGITGEATATPAGSNFAIGVRGLAVSTSDGINYGAYGQASGSSNINRGVVGVLSGTVTTNDAGLYSIANGTGKNIAVYGRAISSNSGGTNYGLYTRALNADTNYAAYFEAGNVYINDKLGLGVNVPSTQFQIGPGNDVNLNSGSGMMMLGYESGQNMIFDENEIQARTGLAGGQLLLQPEGGEVQINGALGGGNNFMFTGGKMGIGNYSPTRSIDAYSSAGIAAIKLSGTGDTWSYSGIELGSGSTTNQWMMYHRKFTGEENALMFQYFNGSNYFTRLLIDSAGSISFNDAYTFPTADGTSGQVLSTDGSGNLSWANTTSGADNLGNHTATQNIKMNGNYLSNDGDNEGVFVATDGKVGIGNNSPNYILDVRSAGTDDDALFQISNSDASHRLMLYPGRQNDPNPFILWSKTDPLRFATDSSGFKEVMRLTNEGKLGIGTTAPTAKLQVAADTSNASFLFNGILVENSATGTSQNAIITARTNENGGTPAFALDVNNVGGFSIAMNQADTSLQFHNSPDPNNPFITMKSNGNMGIGTSSPQAKLDVAGTMKVNASTGSGQLTVNTATEYYAGEFVNNTVTSVAEGLRATAQGSGSGGNIGLRGEASGATYNYGVYGSTSGSGTNYAGYFGDGAVYVTDSLILPKNAGAGKILTSDASGNASWQTPSSSTSSFIQDADANTKIQVEESSNENIIRFDLNGTENFRFLTGGRMEVSNSGNSIFIGNGAGTNDDLSTNVNVFIGEQAGNSNTTGSNQIAIGYNALKLNDTGGYNTAVGSQSLYSNTSGNNNVAIGQGSLYSNTTGNGNVAVGSGVLQSTSVATENTGVGYLALSSTTTGSANSSFGNASLFLNTTGHSNAAFGSNSLRKNVDGVYNTVMGNNVGYEQIGGNYNVLLGADAGHGSTAHTKSGNIFIGYQAGYSDTTDNKLYIENSNSSTPLIYGDFANDSLKIYGKLAIGNAFTFPTADGTSGQFLTTNGSGVVTWGTPSTTISALIQDADANTKIQVEESSNENIIRFDVNGTEIFKMDGRRLQIYNTGESVYLGESAGISDNSGTKQNVGIGLNALGSGTTANQNVAVGRNAARNISTGAANVAIGDQTLYSVGTGSGNVGIGHNVGVLNEDASGNVLIGASADYFNTGGHNNVIIGNSAGAGSTTHTKSGNIRIGYNAGYSDTTDNKLYIENSNSSTPLIYGDFANDSLKIYGKLAIGNAFTFPTSDGTSGQVLTTNGSGVVTWGTAASGAFTTSGTTIRAANSNYTYDFVVGSASLDYDGTNFKRMFFDQSKAAFRAGSSVSYWNVDSLGNYSAAMGENTVASGDWSFAMGRQANARGNYSTALGYFSEATNDYSIAMGFAATSNGKRSFAVGDNSLASGYRTMAIGSFVTAYDSASVAIGSSAKAYGTNSVAIGYGAETKSFAEVAVGSYPTTYTPSSTSNWSATDRIFSIGNGTSSSSRSNALTVLKNGKVGIGNSTPSNALTVYHNGASTDASTAAIKFGDVGGSAYLASGTTYTALFDNTGTNRLTILQSNGNVGISNVNPTSAVDVNGSVEVGSADAFYMGDPTTDGTWRIIRSGTALEFQRRESGTWVYKMQINP